MEIQQRKDLYVVSKTQQLESGNMLVIVIGFFTRSALMELPIVPSRIANATHRNRELLFADATPLRDLPFGYSDDRLSIKETMEEEFALGLTR